jgi:integrase/recombinase XerD
MRNFVRSGIMRPLIESQPMGVFSNVSLSMLFKEIYGIAGIRTSSHSGRRAKGVGMRTIQKLMGHRHIGTTALCNVSEDVLRNAVELA